MSSSLVFLPDISGFTKFVQSTEVSHSQHIIAELLELLIASNDIGLELAEVEGDALFYYKEDPLPTAEELLGQIDRLMTVFYSHLNLFQKNRICPCKACITAPELDLKIIAHSGELQFMEVQGKRKPFGPEVIQAHRLMKNSVDSDRYVLLSQALTTELGLKAEGGAAPYVEGQDTYDDVAVDYVYRVIDRDSIELIPHPHAIRVELDTPPSFALQRTMPTSAEAFLQIITDYAQRPYWTVGLDAIEFNENEVTRLGTEHTCVLDGKHLDFTAVTKDVPTGRLVYGECTTTLPLPKIDRLYSFHVITPIDDDSCDVTFEGYLQADSWLGRCIASLASGPFKKEMGKGLEVLAEYIEKVKAGQPVEPL